jgi:hypothetical protein
MITYKEVDFSELKMPVGRPPEDQLEERKDLKPYIRERKFVRRWGAFFTFWESFIITKAKRAGKLKYIEYAQEFYGEVIAKFEELSDELQDEVISSEKPIARLYELTNLSKPTLFHSKDDNEAFEEILMETTL